MTGIDAQLQLQAGAIPAIGFDSAEPGQPYPIPGPDAR